MTRPRLLLTALAALAVALLVAVVVLAVMDVRRQAVAQARDEGHAASRAAVEQVLSYSPDTAEADITRARGSVAGPFAEQFGALLDQLVRPSLERGLATRTRVTRSAVVDATADTVTSVMFLEQSASAGGGPPQVTASQARVTATETTGRWLITDLQSR